MLMLAAWLMFAPAPQIYAHLVLEINPAVRLTVDSSGRVAGVEALDPEAYEIIWNSDLLHNNLPQAVTLIIDRLHDHGLLTPDRKMFLLIYPAADAIQKDQLAPALEKAHTAVSRRLNDLNLKITVKQFTMESATYLAAEQAGLRPSQYLQLLDYNVSSEILSELFLAGEEYGIEEEIFAERFPDLAELVAVMLEAGGSEKEALRIVKALLAAGAGAELLEKALSTLQENLEEGKNPAWAINQLYQAIITGRFDQAEDRDDDNNGGDPEKVDEVEVEVEDKQDALEKDEGAGFENNRDDGTEEAINSDDRARPGKPDENGNYEEE
jgi:hypothetical protein